MTARSGLGRAALLALGAALGCGGGSGPSIPSPQVGVVPGMVSRDCRYTHTPGGSPPLNQLARAGLRGNIALWGRDMAAGDTVELSVRYTGDGRLLWVEAIRSTVGPERIPALEELVLEALDDVARPDWGVRIFVVGGDVVGLAPSVICAPEARLGSTLRPSLGALRDFWLVEGRRFPVRIDLDERGNVIGVRLVRRTHSRAVDQYIMDYVWQSSFYPKLHDGIGLPSTLTVNIEFPRRLR